MDPIILAKTYTTKFMLPLLLNDGITYDMLFNYNFSNAYITQLETISEDTIIAVTFHNPDFIGRQYSLFTTEELDYSTLEDNSGWKLIYKLNNAYDLDYIHFMSGNYSLLSDLAKFKILNFWKADTNSLIYSILYKDSTNIQTFIKNIQNPKDPWKKHYVELLKRVERNDELYKAPTLSSEIDFLITEGDI